MNTRSRNDVSLGLATVMRRIDAAARNASAAAEDQGTRTRALRDAFPLERVRVRRLRRAVRRLAVGIRVRRWCLWLCLPTAFRRRAALKREARAIQGVEL